MARIVLGLGLAHTPQLHTPPEEWAVRIEADVRNPRLWFRGRSYDWAGLNALRAAEGLAAQCTVEVIRQRHAQAHAALARLAALWREVRPDVAVVFGNDQQELFVGDLIPAFTIFWGAEVQNVPSTPAQAARKPPGIHTAHQGHAPPVALTHPGHPALGRHLLESVIADGFDVAQSQWLREADQRHSWSTGMPHAFGFIYRQIMGDQVPPHVPVLINTAVAPNQPLPQRCLAFGRALGRAIRAWDSDARVAVLSSGGLSHFVVDEAFDRQFLDDLLHGRHDAMADHPQSWLQSGTGECKNWIGLAGLVEGAGLTPRLVDYVPCYRSAAGTGTGAAFVSWS